MGYTHYWTFKGQRGQTSQNEKKYQTAILKCAKVVRSYSETFGGLSGFSAHCAPKQYGGLNFNGSERVGQCETFVLREHMSQNEAFNFCKTRQYPYDTVVTACLIILKHCLGDAIEVGSDGDDSEWADGLTLARQVLGLKSLKIPVSIRVKGKVA